MKKPWAGRTTKPKKGIHEYTFQMRAVRPKHAKSTAFEREWFLQCDEAFQLKMMKELRRRQKEKIAGELLKRVQSKKDLHNETV